MEEVKNKAILFLSLAGFAVATLAGLSEFVPALQALCTSFSDGCRETMSVTLFRLPLWVWGIGFYGLLTLAAWRLKSWTAGLVGVVFGVEVALLWIMVSMKAICMFCLANALIVVLLVVFAFDRNRLWQAFSLCLLAFIAVFALVTHENSLFPFSAAPPRTEQPQQRVVAKVGDKTMTEDQLETIIAPSLFDLEKERYRLKKERLDQWVMEEVLQKEAATRGMTLEQLADSLGKDMTVSETEVDRYLQDNQQRISSWTGSMEELRSRVKTFLEQQKRFEKVKEFVKANEGKYGATVALPEPQIRLVNVDISGNISQGPADAPVTVVEFSDYQCPACRQAHDTVKQIREMYKGRIRWIFKDYPLKRHKDAQRAAEAARCVAEHGKFWEYQDLLYSAQEDLTPEKLEQLAGSLGVDTTVFRQCLDSGKYKAAVEKDINDAKTSGVDRTPGFLVNGKVMFGAPPLEKFRDMIDGELGKVEKKK
ncbi:MAG: thioredoxin domain-containing protein [Acidobacteriota bacterium]